MADAARSSLNNITESLDNVERALSRTNMNLDDFRNLVRHSGTGENGDGGGTADSSAHFQQAMKNLDDDLASVHKTVADVPSTISSLGLAAYLFGVQKPPEDSTVEDVKNLQSVYDELMGSYAAHERYREYCTTAFNALSSYLIRSSAKNSGSSRPVLTKAFYMDDNTQRLIDRLFRSLGGSLPALSWQTYNLGGSLTAIEIIVDRIFRVLLLLRGLVVEAVNVRSSEESFNLEPNAVKSLDLWTPSALETYRVISANATAAVLHFYNPNSPEFTLRNFLQWINSYTSLFTSPCKICGRLLQQGLAPTWRDYRKFEPYHEVCRKMMTTPL